MAKIKITPEEKKLYKSKEYLKEHYTGNVMTRNKAIKEKCMDCCCWQSEEVLLCPVTKCALWPYRFGSNPFGKTKVMTEEQKAAIRNRFTKSEIIEEDVESEDDEEGDAED